jgi:hypothetical protein
MYQGSTLWREEVVPGKAKNTQNSPPAKSLSIVFRTVQADGLLVYTATNNDFTSLEVSSPLLHFCRITSATKLK